MNQHNNCGLSIADLIKGLLYKRQIEVYHTTVLPLAILLLSDTTLILKGNQTELQVYDMNSNRAVLFFFTFEGLQITTLQN